MTTNNPPRIRLFFSTITATLLAVGSFAPIAASADEVGAYYPAEFPTESQQSFYIMDGETSDYVPSHITVLHGDNTQHLCGNDEGDFGVSADVLGRAGSGACGLDKLLEETTFLSGRVLLGPCTTAEQEFCIEDLQIGTTSLTSATFVRQVAGPTFSGEGRVAGAVPIEGLGEFDGGTVSLWSSSTNHSAGQGKYAVNVAVLVEADYELNTDGDRVAYTGLKYSGIAAAVTPYVDLDTSSDDGFSLTDLTIEEREIVEGDPSTQVVSWSGGDGPRCAYAEEDLCGRIVDFAPSTKVKLAVRVPKSIGGFFKGRMTEPEISINSLSANSQLIEVTAEPVKVPRFEHSMATSDIDRTEVIYTYDDPESGPFSLTVDDMGLVSVDGSDQILGALRGGYFASSPGAFDLIEWLKDKPGVEDTISGYNTLWSFGTIGNQVNPALASDEDDPLLCLADTTKVLGVVTSNAMAYQDSPPEITYDDEGNSSLGYKVAGLHFETDGTTPVLGTYDLVLDSDVARCLYPELEDLPEGQLDADVAVTEIAPTLDGADVAKAVPTVSITESDGWLRLSASGFTFSTNEISVSLKPKQQNTSGTTTTSPVTAPITTAPAPVTPPAIPATETGAVLVDGQPVNVTITPSAAANSLEVKGDDWSLQLSPSTTGNALNEDGELVLNPQTTPDLSGSGFQANSKAAAYLIPSAATQVAALGITAAQLRILAGEINLGEIAVDADGSFNTNLDLSEVAAGDYILQINGAAPDGKIRSISIRATVADVALKGWTKKISETQVKVYVKNVVGAGKVQIFQNGKEIAWINAGDETDRKLRFAQGFNYLVRTINLEPGKNRIEIRVDGVRERFVTYTQK